MAELDLRATRAAAHRFRGCTPTSRGDGPEAALELERMLALASAGDLARRLHTLRTRQEA